MQLRNELVFQAARGPKLELTLPDKEGEEDKLTLGLKAAFNSTLATELGVEWMFATETVAHRGLKDAKLENSIAFTDCELKLRGGQGELDTFFPEKIYGFRVFAIGGAGLGIQCKVDVTGDFNDILNFFRSHIADGFEFIIKGRQGELFEGGTRVDMSEDTPENPAAPMEMAILEDASVDRSYENKPPPSRGKGRPRGSRNKVVEIGGTTDLPVEENKEWNEFYNNKAGEPVNGASESEAEMLDLLGALVPE